MTNLKKSLRINRANWWTARESTGLTTAVHLHLKSLAFFLRKQRQKKNSLLAWDEWWSHFDKRKMLVHAAPKANLWIFYLMTGPYGWTLTKPCLLIRSISQMFNIYLFKEIQVSGFRSTWLERVDLWWLLILYNTRWLQAMWLYEK